MKRCPVRGAEAKVYRLDVDALVGLVQRPAMERPLAAPLKSTGLAALWAEVLDALPAGALAPVTTSVSWSPIKVDEAGWVEIRSAIEAGIRGSELRGGVKRPPDCSLYFASPRIAATPGSAKNCSEGL